MSFLVRALWGAVVLGAVCAPVFAAGADAPLAPATVLAAVPAPTGPLGVYLAALDDLGAGRVTAARDRLLAPAAQPLEPESLALLAYLQQRCGDVGGARATLTASAAPSPLAQAYLTQLGGPLELVASKPAEVPVRLATSDSRVLHLETYLAGLVNDERTKMGLPLLAYNARMAEIARAHSAEMRDKGYFSHFSPTPALRASLDRYILGMGLTPHVVAENIYRAYGGHNFLNEPDVLAAHEALMHSPGHRANILYPEINTIGVGIVVDGTGAIWITELFARPTA